MSARGDSSVSGLDTAKQAVAVLVLVGGIAAFYVYAGVGLPYRVLMVLASALLSLWLVLTTVIGRQFLGFLAEARTEVRKVVWPTRQETMQSTLVVVALVFLVGLLLWTLDAALYWGISLMTGQGK